VLFLLFIIIRVKVRGFFWRARDGSELSFKETRALFLKGVEGITPVQQTRTTLIALVPIVSGTIWGIVVMVIGKVWWASLILTASLPIQFIQVVNNYQKYKAQKRVEDTIKELNLGENIQ
jgi:hypothetical protein